MTATFAFRRIASDREGYYYDDWQKALPMTVESDTEKTARAEATRISGDPPRGRFWKFHLDSVSAAVSS